MKKIIGVLLLLGFSFLCYLFFIPTEITAQTSIYIHANYNSAYRALLDTGRASQWHTGGKITKNKENRKAELSFTNDEFLYTIKGGLINGLLVEISSRSLQLRSSLKIVPLSNDSLFLTWGCIFPNAVNPFQKVRLHALSIMLAKNMSEVVNRFKQFSEQEKNIYGVVIQRSRVTDRFLVTMQKSIDHYPDNTFIYDIINSLRDYIAQHAASATNFPMLHLDSSVKNHFEITVAIPTNKKLENTNDVVIKEMMPGNILVAEVTGGDGAIRQTFTSIENYMQDHQLSSPAIPFQLLVTDRMVERDSAKWVTKIYYPVY